MAILRCFTLLALDATTGLQLQSGHVKPGPADMGAGMVMDPGMEAGMESGKGHGKGTEEGDPCKICAMEYCPALCDGASMENHSEECGDCASEHCEDVCHMDEGMGDGLDYASALPGDHGGAHGPAHFDEEANGGAHGAPGPLPPPPSGGGEDEEYDPTAPGADAGLPDGEAAAPLLDGH